MPRVCIIPKVIEKCKNGITFSEEAKICLDCPMPENECKPSTCRRYHALKRKLIEGKKNGKRKKVGKIGIS